jgi:DNA processing protein
MILKEQIGLTNKQYVSIRSTNRDHIVSLLEKRLERGECRLIVADDEEYPPLLRQSDAAPPVLFARGQGIIWSDYLPAVAVVGTRTMTAYGQFATQQLVSELAVQLVPVVSGLMYGIDTTAHIAAQRAGGRTIAVLGYGFDHCYPEEQRPIVEEVLAKGGLLLTEYPPWQPARRGNFPARNSIVAGMSSAVVVVEAALGSGSLLTAQYALDDNRQVCAVPGPITNPYSEGTKWLINQGATLITSASDLLAQTADCELAPTELELMLAK